MRLPTCNPQLTSPVSAVASHKKDSSVAHASTKGRYSLCWPSVYTHRKVSTQTFNHASSAVETALGLTETKGQQRGVHPWRRLRAEVAMSRRRCEGLTRRIEAINRALEDAQAARVNSPKCRAAIRLRNGPVPPTSSAANDKDALATTNRLQADITRRLTDARKVLVREAVAVFGVGLNPKQDWEIAGLALPTPHTFRLHRSNRINAALSHVVHLLSLITRYLGVALPFYPSQQIAHLGRPKMKANTPFIGTTRFQDEPVLWMSSTARADTADKPKSQLKHRRFLTAFALLAHSVAYLAHSQGVTGVGIPNDGEALPTDTTRIPVWSILQLIDAVVKASHSGGFSHEPGGSCSARHALYGLDVVKVVGCIVRSEERRWGPHRLDASDLSEGWDLMESAEEGVP